MSNLIVITFDNEEEAGQVRESVRRLQHGGLVSLDDSAIFLTHLTQRPIKLQR